MVCVRLVRKSSFQSVKKNNSERSYFFARRFFADHFFWTNDIYCDIILFVLYFLFFIGGTL